MSLTPMMQQYLEIHEKVPDAILMFRLGDFYEMFFDDAITASKILEITLTGKDCGLEERAPMCGVPYHSAESYIAKLVEKGHKVAIGEQLEDPALAKGIVKRDIVRVVSPGTYSDARYLSSKKNNYLMSLYSDKNTIGLAYTDVSTGEFFVTDFSGKNRIVKMMDEIGKIAPSEILMNENLYKQEDLVKQLENRSNVMISMAPSIYFNYKKSSELLLRHFKVFSLLSLGLEADHQSVCAAGALLTYLTETQMVALEHINHIQCYKADEFMVLDVATRRNLELTETLRSGEKRGSLLWVLDKTATAMGGRLLRRWVEVPLLSAEAIIDRQDRIAEFIDNNPCLGEIKSVLNRVYDLERICGKIALGTCSPKDMLSLKQSVTAFEALQSIIASMHDAKHWQASFESTDALTDIYALIDESISDDAPFSLKDGNVIKTGYNAQIDEYRMVGSDGKSLIKTLEEKERERTGIKNLKIKYNKVFGYFIEVSKGNVSLVPEDYIRKQTLTNAERFIIPELKEMETKLLGAEEQLSRLEAELFYEIRNRLTEEIKRIQQCAKLIAECDAIYALTNVAICNHYVRPQIVENGKLHIINGRHPVVEEIIGQDAFVYNDTTLDVDERMMLITGPNMAGKSTYIRQVAVITLMTQIGSYVPADAAEISLVDRIFTRVGASDDLATGQSTFMVEMTEVSNILKNATDKSLVILDEIGRGTSTFDGISIAWAVVEYLWDTKKIGAKTLFATHYHELTELESIKDGIVNYSIGVKETKEGVIFLRKIKRGSSDKSYGIEVAKLAGFPYQVTRRAEKILQQLEAGEATYREGVLNNETPYFQNDQINFFNMGESQPQVSETEMDVLEDIKSLDINALTPMEAMIVLHQFNQKLKGSTD